MTKASKETYVIRLQESGTDFGMIVDTEDSSSLSILERERGR